MLEGSAKLAERLANADGSLAARAHALAGRLETLLYPSSRAARRERRFLKGLRGFVDRMRNIGVADEAIAASLTQALRGVDSPPPELREVLCVPHAEEEAAGQGAG